MWGGGPDDFLIIQSELSHVYHIARNASRKTHTCHAAKYSHSWIGWIGQLQRLDHRKIQVNKDYAHIDKLAQRVYGILSTGTGDRQWCHEPTNQTLNTTRRPWAGQDPYFIPSRLMSTTISKILQNKKPAFRLPQCKKGVFRPVIPNSSVLLSWINEALLAVASCVARRGSSKPPVNQEGTRWQATAWLIKILFLE